MGRRQTSRFRRHCRCCYYCSFLTVTLLSCIAAVGLSLCLKNIGPEARLSVNREIQGTDCVLSLFPQFCESVNVSCGVESNVTVIVYLGKQADEPSQEECILEQNEDTSCVMPIPFSIGLGLYAKINANSSVNEQAAKLELDCTCAPRLWLYIALSLIAFFILTILGALALCCCVCVCCRARVPKDDNNLFIYTPLLNPTDPSPTETEKPEHSLMVGSMNTPEGVVPVLQPQAEMSSSYKYSSFKPGTKPGGTLRTHQSPKRKAEPKSPKKSYATISGTYTFNSFKPEN